jgi:dienelactone hydrolase
MFGRRAVEHAAAEGLRAKGLRVVVPDLFTGSAVPGGIAAGFALMEQIGWNTIVDRARRSLSGVPRQAVLGGFSMGAGVIGEIWPERLEAAGVFCLHAPTNVPKGVPVGTPVQLHVAKGDSFAAVAQIADFEQSSSNAGAASTVYEYAAAGHFFTDESLPDYDATATATAWARVDTLLASVV